MELHIYDISRLRVKQFQSLNHDDLKMAVIEYVRNADRAILNTDRAVLNTVCESSSECQ
jgi:hypothetical protein